jgi:hypothetical protein
MKASFNTAIVAAFLALSAIAGTAQAQSATQGEDIHYPVVQVNGPSATRADVANEAHAAIQAGDIQNGEWSHYSDAAAQAGHSQRAARDTVRTSTNDSRQNGEWANYPVRG